MKMALMFMPGLPGSITQQHHERKQKDTKSNLSFSILSGIVARSVRQADQK
jgi:hypothetical protein